MPYPDSLQGLSLVEADLMAAVTAHGVIGNGGHDFWYQGRNREHTLRAADAFERMGEGDAADAMRRSLEAFPTGRPTEDYVFAHRTELKDLFSPLDEIIWMWTSTPSPQGTSARRRRSCPRPTRI